MHVYIGPRYIHIYCEFNYALCTILITMGCPCYNVIIYEGLHVVCQIFITENIDTLVLDIEIP